MPAYLTFKDISDLAPWGSFPKKLRRFYVAQNGKCAYCARIVEFTSSLKPHEHIRPNKVIPSTDHVWPRRGGKGAGLELGNKVMACAQCNFRKQDRKPRPCEVLFAIITGEIVISMLPPHDAKCYLGRQQQAAKDEANEQRV